MIHHFFYCSIFFRPDHIPQEIPNIHTRGKFNHGLLSTSFQMIFWLVVWLPFFIFPLILGISSSQLTKSYFSEGWRKTTNQSLGLREFRFDDLSAVIAIQDDLVLTDNFGPAPG